MLGLRKTSAFVIVGLTVKIAPLLASVFCFARVKKHSNAYRMTSILDEAKTGKIAKTSDFEITQFILLNKQKSRGAAFD